MVTNLSLSCGHHIKLLSHGAKVEKKKRVCYIPQSWCSPLLLAKCTANLSGKLPTKNKKIIPNNLFVVLLHLDNMLKQKSPGNKLFFSCPAVLQKKKDICRLFFWDWLENSVNVAIWKHSTVLVCKAEFFETTCILPLCSSVYSLTRSTGSTGFYILCFYYFGYLSITI